MTRDPLELKLRPPVKRTDPPLSVVCVCQNRGVVILSLIALNLWVDGSNNSAVSRATRVNGGFDPSVPPPLTSTEPLVSRLEP